MARRLLTPERESELLARYPTESNNALAQAFDLTPAQVAHIAWEKQVTKTYATRSAINGKRAHGASAMQQVRAAVIAAGAAGMCRADILAALPGVNVYSAPDSLAARGYLHAAGPRGATRYFGQAEHARAHAQACKGAGPRQSQSQRAVKRRLREQRERHSAVAAPALAPAQAPACAAARAPITSRLFADLGAGQYVDAEPCAWVAAITRRA